MANLRFGAITSLDGYIADEQGTFDWAAPDDEVHAFVNDQERSAGTYLMGRRMYEVMAVWETDPSFTQHSALLRDYAAIWQAADKVVYSTTLEQVVTQRTRLERAFDAEEVRRLKASATADLTIAGPTLAGAAFRAGLVDEVSLYVVPVIVGGGTRALPDGVRLDLELVEERRFASGFVFLHYRRRPGG